MNHLPYLKCKSAGLQIDIVRVVRPVEQVKALPEGDVRKFCFVIKFKSIIILLIENPVRNFIFRIVLEMVNIQVFGNLLKQKIPEISTVINNVSADD